MNTIELIGIASLALVLAAPTSAQETEGAEQRQRGPDRARGQEQTALTAEQTAQVKAILGKYNPRTLTAADARAIHRAFRDAGLRGGPAMRSAIEAAGFDADRLRELAPPPRRGRSGGRGPEGDAGPQRRGDREDQTSLDGGGPLAARDGQEPETTSPGERDGGRDATREGRRSREGDGRPAGQEGQGRYSIDQAVSDRAQLHTIAFSGLAFLTGDFGAATFLPPGKVCDFFGFQYMRDIDAGGRGHNPMFLSRIAGDVLRILNESQRMVFEDLAQEQAPLLEQLALKRFPVIRAFQRHLEGDSLDRQAVVRSVGDIFALDARLSYRRAQVFGLVARSLTASQKEELGRMKFGDFRTWPALDERDARQRPARGRSKLFGVAYMTYASEFFSWYAGSVEADTYFCPERHGTYFGGFYMKDMPAMGRRDYDISTSVTGDKGEAFLALLRPDQRARITSIIGQQRDELAQIIALRRAVATELRGFLEGRAPDEQEVIGLGRRYGEMDGAVSYLYATAFADVSRSLSSEQRTAMSKLRELEEYRSAPAYIYSQPIGQEGERPAAVREGR